MKGDFSRITFDPAKHYSAVLMQQGRVQLDADWNEQVEIQAYQRQTEAQDVIGQCGVPKRGGGFKISSLTNGSDLLVSPGRIYVGGRLCELEEATPVSASLTSSARQLRLSIWKPDNREFALGQWLSLSAPGVATPKLVRIARLDQSQQTLTVDSDLPEFAGIATISVRRLLSYLSQPDYPNPTLTSPATQTNPALLNLTPGTYLAYLDVFERHITVLDDPELREVALNGPDTTTRLKTIWQVKLLQVGNETASLTCKSDFPPLAPGSNNPPGRLSARATPETPQNEPCDIPPGAGYRGLENQLYRVEVHESGLLGQATFKWSRDNGSVVTRWTGQGGTGSSELTVSSTGRDSVLGFVSGGWVELTDDSHELFEDLNSPTSRPGTLVKVVRPDPQLLTIDPTTATGAGSPSSINRADFPLNPKIRRWDSPGLLKIEQPAANGGWLKLEEGIEVRFENGFYQSGDYWLLPARTATNTVDWPFETPQLPQGINHYYCHLALLRFSAGNLQVLEDCRPTFPSLTTICAEDICYDNTNCQLPNADTVQEALDRLCRERDLRFHNKHLHGWGIVCGLEVTCGPDQGERRENVTVHQGYALDCEGNDLLLEKDVLLNLMERVRKFDDNHPNGRILDEKGDGEACLFLSLDEGQRLGVDLKKFDPASRRPEALMAGTLLMDFYNDCLKKIQDFLKEELTPAKGEENLPAGPVQQRLSALTNLLAQTVNPETGQRVFISPREHRILEEFYLGLRALLQSETFCAMFEQARPFPRYPFEDLGLDTIFGRNQNTRLRLRPGRVSEAYSVGAGLNPLEPSTTINRYDLTKKLLVAQFNPLAGSEVNPASQNNTGAGAVQDVAFSPDGRLIYVIAPTRNEENTFFRVGEIGANTINWRPVVTICGVKLVTLAVTAADEANVYAIGLKKVTVTSGGTTRTEFRGAGLYRINPNQVDPNMNPLVAFNAFGNLRITRDGRAFATFKQGDIQPNTYDQVKLIQLPAGSLIRDIALNNNGQDDIAVFTRTEGVKQDTLYTIVGSRGQGKAVLAHDIATGQPLVEPIPVEDSTVRLEPFPPTRMLLMTVEDGYCVRIIDMQTNQLVPDYLLPMQVAPLAIATDGKDVYVQNYVSNTLTTARGSLFRPEFRFPLAELATYRKQMIEAFADLLGGFAQYLKDCFCDHLLTKCPDCGNGDTTLYLGCVSIRKGQVYKICNFTLRREVKTFPKVGYWLSLVPVLPWLDFAIEQFCCAILPEFFGRYQVAEFDESKAQSARSRVQAEQFRQGLSVLQNLDFSSWWRELFTRGQFFGRTLGTSLSRGRADQFRVSQPRISSTDLVNQPAANTETFLKAQGVGVRRATYDPTFTPDPISVFRTPAPGSEVTLYEDEQGRVKYYTVGQADPGKDLSVKLNNLAQTVEARDTQLQELQTRLEAQQNLQADFDTLKTQLSETQAQLGQREAETRALRGQLEDLQRKQADLEQNVPTSRVTQLETELKELRDFRAEVTKFMQRGQK